MNFHHQNPVPLREILGSYMKILGEMSSLVVVVNADLMGTSRNTGFVQEFPERSFNVGIAEQNMVSFAAGLAHEGFIPYAFSMAPFVTMRACEQCRTDVAYADLNVRLIGSYAGYSGGISGATHWALEDCAIMTSMNNMTVIEVSDPYQIQQVLLKSLTVQGPWYIRCGVQAVHPIYSKDVLVEIGRALIPCEGDDGAFICSGVVVPFAIEASKVISERFNKNIRVVDMFTLKPIDRDAICAAAKTGRVIVAQDHNVIGGLGQLVATVIAEEGIPTKFKILGCNSKFETMAHAEYLYHKNEYDVEGLVKHMQAFLENN